MEILIKRLTDKAVLPAYSSEAGPEIDISSLEEVTIEPGAKIAVSTGVAMALPIGYIGLLWNKSGISINDSVKVTAEVIDSGYRAEILVEMENTGDEARAIAAGEKIAQLLIQKVERANLIEAADLSSS
jgi:dUTP pyrophosphatase